MSQLLLHTKSRIGGKNADVHIYDNRIEWAREAHGTGWNITAITLAVFTACISLIFMRPSFKTQATAVIPAAKISSIETKKDGPVNTKVTVIIVGEHHRVPYGSRQGSSAQVHAHWPGDLETPQSAQNQSSSRGSIGRRH
ncbi:hypothetical protein JM654_03745 [Microbacterium oxydans]|nr:hypothetical protein [Microbacterium oxydans]